MPRRIPDYPDAYAPFNYVSSIGSMISFVSTLFFFLVVYLAITKTPRDSSVVRLLIGDVRFNFLGSKKPVEFASASFPSLFSNSPSTGVEKNGRGS